VTDENWGCGRQCRGVCSSRMNRCCILEQQLAGADWVQGAGLAGLAGLVGWVGGLGGLGR
jgi:hypothetical protein